MISQSADSQKPTGVRRPLYQNRKPSQSENTPLQPSDLSSKASIPKTNLPTNQPDNTKLPHSRELSGSLNLHVNTDSKKLLKFNTSESELADDKQNSPSSINASLTSLSSTLKYIKSSKTYHFTVGPIENGNATLINEEFSKVCMPLSLLPLDVKQGNILKFTVERNLPEEEIRRDAITNIQREILQNDISFDDYKPKRNGFQLDNLENGVNNAQQHKETIKLRKISDKAILPHESYSKAGDESQNSKFRKKDDEEYE